MAPDPVQAGQKREAAAARWGLRDLSVVADTPTSRVFRARDESGTPSALKILKPYGADEMNGVRLLTWYGGRGAVEVLDQHDGMILMEWLDGATLGDLVRADHGRDAEATDVMCAILRRLHAPRQGPAPALTPLEAWFRRLLDARLDFLPGRVKPLWTRARRLATKLIETTTTAVPLHGDFHHDNIIGSPRGWLVIDPKGLVGDPAYEVANVFRNPYRAEGLAARPARIEALADAFAQNLDLDRRRILAWAAVHSAISAIWDHAAGNAFTWDLTMTPLLFAALDRAGPQM